MATESVGKSSIRLPQVTSAAAPSRAHKADTAAPQPPVELGAGQAEAIEKAAARAQALIGAAQEVQVSAPQGRIPGLVDLPSQAFSETKARAEMERLGADVIELAQGQPVSLEGAKALLGKLSRNLVFERYYSLRNWYLSHKGAFSPEAQARIERFITKEGPARLKYDPVHGVDQSKLPLEPGFDAAWYTRQRMKAVTYTEVAGEISDTPDAHGLQQGSIGDCYFDAIAAWFAASVPASGDSFYKKAIRENADGTFSTTFYVQERHGAPIHPVEVTVTGLLPTIDGRLVGLRDREGDDLGPALYEKLWAKFKGSYGAIAGGLPVDVMLAVSGKPAAVEPIFVDSDPDAVFALVAAAQQRGEVMAADTYAVDPSGTPMNDTHTFPGTNVVCDHAYTVFGAVEKDGKKYIELRNPWGRFEPNDPSGKALDGKDDGRFLLPVEQFVQCYMGFSHGAAQFGPPSAA